MSYVRSTWLDGNWPPQDWSVYGQAVRTYDVEGCHHRINGNASSSHVLFYVLVQLLFRESQHVKLQVRLVKDRMLARYQRRTYRQLQGHLFSLWEKYERHNIITTHLLSTAARIYGPTAIHPMITILIPSCLSRDLRTFSEIQFASNHIK